MGSGPSFDIQLKYDAEKSSGEPLLAFMSRKYGLLSEKVKLVYKPKRHACIIQPRNNRNSSIFLNREEQVRN